MYHQLMKFQAEKKKSKTRLVKGLRVCLVSLQVSAQTRSLFLLRLLLHQRRETVEETVEEKETEQREELASAIFFVTFSSLSWFT